MLYSNKLTNVFFFSVLVTVTPGINVTTHPDTTTPDQANQLQGGCTSRPTLLAPPTNYSQFELSGFIVDWCQYRLLNLTSETPPTPGTTVEEELPPAVPLVGTSVVVLVVIAATVAALLAVVICITLCVCFSRRRHA